MSILLIIEYSYTIIAIGAAPRKAPILRASQSAFSSTFRVITSGNSVAISAAVAARKEGVQVLGGALTSCFVSTWRQRRRRHANISDESAPSRPGPLDLCCAEDQRTGPAKTPSRPPPQMLPVFFTFRRVLRLAGVYT
eukprot:1180266-Prorocentrum_minimum.AAC.3